MSFLLGLALFLVMLVAGASRDPIGLGYLLSSQVDPVAQGRLSEPVFTLPPLYALGALCAGAGAAHALAGRPVVVRCLAGAALAVFLVLTIWDIRRRRGTVAVYVTLRRQELGWRPRGDVIEVPKLMFLVMKQPTPLVWLATALAFGAAGIAVVPAHAWAGAVAFFLPAALLALVWARNRKDPWERLARRLRRASLKSGDDLLEHLRGALDVDPEVAIIRREADAMVARVVHDTM